MTIPGEPTLEECAASSNQKLPFPAARMLKSEGCTDSNKRSIHCVVHTLILLMLIEPIKSFDDVRWTKQLSEGQWNTWIRVVEWLGMC